MSCATHPFSAIITLVIYTAPPALVGHTLGLGGDGSLDLALSNTTVPTAVFLTD